MEEYELEDPYDEVKRFSELTEEEIDMVAEKLRKVSLKFQHAEFIAQQIKGEKVVIEEKADGEEEEIKQLHHSKTTPAKESNKSTIKKRN